MMSAKLRPYANKLFEPAVDCFIRIRVTPNQMTVLGLIIGLAACAVYLVTRSTIIFFVLIIFAGLFDVFDGMVARKTGKTTKFGAYLDAVCDRLFEGFVALTIAIATGEWILICLCIIGAISISYAKARAAIEVSISNTEWPDLMERAERAVIFVFGFFISEFTGIQFWGHPLFFWILVLLNVAIYSTVVQRILRAKQYIEARA